MIPLEVRAALALKDRQIAELSRRVQKLALVALTAINRAEAAEDKLAELRGRIEPMAMVYPWAKEERNVTA